MCMINEMNNRIQELELQVEQLQSRDARWRSAYVKLTNGDIVVDNGDLVGLCATNDLMLEFDAIAGESPAQSLAEIEPSMAPGSESFQSRIAPWMQACFGPEISMDAVERNHRFLEEALELVQSCGCTASESHQLVDYVFDRPVGEPNQEAGGVMVTLAALCLANDLDMHECGEIELARIWTKVEKIRAKQAAKPKHSPLPQSEEATLIEIEAKAVNDFCRDIGLFEGEYDDQGYIEVSRHSLREYLDKLRIMQEATNAA